jgi:hypothetical protein
VQKKPIILKEYGRIFQEFISYIVTLEDKDMRKDACHYLVDMIIRLNPQLNSIENIQKIVWDQLFYVSNYTLNVDSPYEITRIDELKNIKANLTYPLVNSKNKHYGKYIVNYIDHIKDMNSDEIKSMTPTIASFMKAVHKNWNNEMVNDEIVKNDLFTISDKKILMDEDETIKNVPVVRQHSKPYSHNKNKYRNQKFKQR